MSARSSSTRTSAPGAAVAAGQPSASNAAAIGSASAALSYLMTGPGTRRS
ncbi:hypothetical protein [Phytohabitans houttuyneae]